MFDMPLFKLIARAPGLFKLSGNVLTISWPLMAYTKTNKFIEYPLGILS
jgi:hypothetical protein